MFCISRQEAWFHGTTEASVLGLEPVMMSRGRKSTTSTEFKTTFSTPLVFAVRMTPPKVVNCQLLIPSLLRAAVA